MTDQVPYLPDAACGDLEPERWFPTSIGPKRAIEDAHAKAICGGCPEQAACLTWALEIGESHGIWGGLDETERAAITAAGRPAPPAAAARPTRAQRRRQFIVESNRPGYIPLPRGGAPRALAEQRVIEARRLKDAGMGRNGIAAALGTHTRTVDRLLRKPAA